MFLASTIIFQWFSGFITFTIEMKLLDEKWTCDTDNTTRPIHIFFSYRLTLIRPILVFRILSRFYIHINDKIETLCHCRLQSLLQSCKDR
jgi:hypothetical protein